MFPTAARVTNIKIKLNICYNNKKSPKLPSIINPSPTIVAINRKLFLIWCDAHIHLYEVGQAAYILCKKGQDQIILSGDNSRNDWQYFKTIKSKENLIIET